jgi:hypothetical protein
MDILFRPLGIWPGTPAKFRGRSKFRAGYGDTLKLLDRELRHLRAKNVVIQLALTSRDIRLDGMPRVGARPTHPGVILAFDSKHGPLSYPCDVYSEWEDNMRAIALSLEHLRAVDRYGVTRQGEQYRGWTALPAPREMPRRMTKDEAAGFISKLIGGDGQTAEEIMGDPETRATAIRAAQFKTHPDREGDPEQFRKVQEAKEVLEA